MQTLCEFAGGRADAGHSFGMSQITAISIFFLTMALTFEKLRGHTGNLVNFPGFDPAIRLENLRRAVLRPINGAEI
jgi:hypothetical protein